MSTWASKSYSSVALDTGVSAGDPHQLITMLFDGALTAVNQARAHAQGKRIADRGAAIGRAIRIIDEGLKISLDPQAGGQLSTRLFDLYEYLVMRLLQANLRNDEAALVEVAQRLGELRDAWTQIRPASQPARDSAPLEPTEPAVSSPAVPQSAAGKAFLTHADVSADQPPRRLTISA